MQRIISKSRYMNGLQCLKLLWFGINEPKEIPEPGIETQFLFDQGHEISKLARTVFPENIEVPHDKNSINTTKKLINQRKSISEGAFSYKGGFAQIDILDPTPEGEWDIIEIKSGTQVKDENVEDVAFQRYIVEGSGLKVRRCYVMHINNEYVRDGEINAEKLLTREDITERVGLRLFLVGAHLEEMRRIISMSKPPETSIGQHCSTPYECSLVEKCWTFLPEHNVTELYYCKEKYELIGKGILAIKDLPTDFKVSEKQQIQKEAIRKGIPIINKGKIAQFLGSLEYPVYCLDFETLNVAIPPFDGARPYQKIPFQFSVHIIRKPKGKMESFEFLADGRENFAPDVVDALRRIGPNGTILAYNMPFEKQVLRSLGELSRGDAIWLDSISERLRDLLLVFRHFAYYHPIQHGSCSLKAVLPALTGRTYKGMEIEEGGKASILYYITHFRDCLKEEKEKVRKALLEYCKLDTEGMVNILERLEELAI